MLWPGSASWRSGGIPDPVQAHVGRLLAEAESHERRGERRAAASFYQAALKAAQEAGQLPSEFRPPLERAQRFLRQAAEEYEAHLERVLARTEAGPRFTEAVDILLGRKAVQLQQPSAFYFPGLPQRPFYAREEFPWAPRLESETAAIRAELQALVGDEAAFQPYVEAERNRPTQDFHGMLGDPSWGAFYLWRDGALVEENAARCPRTVEALSKVPMTRIGARTPSVLFSLLRPGAHIPPHTGMLNSRLICHLPLVVPPGCWLRAGNEVRAWEEGKLLIFDDSFEHEARNPSDALRVILLFDIWKPELSEAERAGVSTLFEAIDGFGG
ncbi:MAG: aspartyl/asparaginyl beta-hydroxylase domain-containing protein [Alphaproteobacteria bacterium]|nr:aspartyl/asparaginyl beta-hydroxylase domain-containing protein [Alphaproteobacteria bacterium]MBV9372574.1 aspartyl/asparaginyl beta-hydroxylase domain-containing protein [Alphaproteobacteria bacterium]MBV9900889.1 aspartyl/asparaginyl beta-hydroxylase domain-containing protein [Alphaproteobacteria bacterium]